MNYTNYLLHEPFVHIEELDTDKFYLKPMVVIVAIPITIATFMVIAGLLPMTLIFDEFQQKRPHREVSVKSSIIKQYHLFIRHLSVLNRPERASTLN
jgi:hypothetical protein